MGCAGEHILGRNVLQSQIKAGESHKEVNVLAGNIFLLARFVLEENTVNKPKTVPWSSKCE
jgi:pantothenate kinase